MEASAEAPVADLVGVEGEELSVVPAGGDDVPDLAASVPDGVAVPVPGRLDFLDGEEVAGIEVEVAAGGPDDEAVAGRDEDLAGIAVTGFGVVAGDGDRDFSGALLVGQSTLAQKWCEGAYLVMGARDDQCGPVGRFLAMAVPVLDKLLQGLVEIPAKMEPVAVAIGGDGVADALLGLLLVIDEPVAEVRRGRDLPGNETGRVAVGAVILDNLLPLGMGHRRQAFARFGRRHVFRMDQDVFGVGALTADLRDGDASGDASQEAQSGPGADGLLLPGIAGPDDAGAGLLGDLEELGRVLDLQLAGLVDDDERLRVELELVPPVFVEELHHAPCGDLRGKPEFVGVPPCLGRAVDLPARLPGYIRNGNERRRLSRAGGAFDNGVAPSGGRDPDRPGLLGAQRFPLFGQHVEVPVDQFGGNVFGRLDCERLGEAPDVALAVEMRPGGEDAGLGHVRLGVGPFAPAVEFEDVDAVEDLGCDGLDLLGREHAGHDAGDALHDVGDVPDGFVLSEGVRNFPEEVADFGFVLLGDAVPGHGVEDGLDVVDELRAVEVPEEGSTGRVEAVVLARSGCLVDPLRAGRIVRSGESLALCGRHDLLASAGPVVLEFLGHAANPEELALPAVALDGQAEALGYVVSERQAVDRTGGPVPLVEGVRVQRPPLAVVGESGVEDDAVCVKLRLVLPR